MRIKMLPCLIGAELFDASGTPIVEGAPETFTKTAQGLLSAPQQPLPVGTQYCYSVESAFAGDSRAYESEQQCGVVQNQTARPTISPFGGEIYKSTPVNITTADTTAQAEYALLATGGNCNYVDENEWLSVNGGELNLEESTLLCARATHSNASNSGIVSLEFSVVNEPPQITSTPATSVISVGGTFSYAVIAEDPDDSSDSFTYQLVTAPQGMTVSTTGLVSWVPVEADIGLHSITVQVSDGVSTDKQTFGLTIKESPPIAVVDIANLNIQNGSFKVNWSLNTTVSEFEIVEEFNGVWGSPQTVTANTYKDFSGKPAGRYRYKVGSCTSGSCSNHRTSAAFTLSAFTPSNAVSDPVDLTGLSGDVGFTAGQFRVSESGAATYSVPLNLPAGVAGVKPQVALNYSSQGGDGNMGRGWSLAVGGAISRCPANMFHNGDISGIRYDDTDLFCLNSQQLVLKAGSYGAANSTYYTAIDGFSIITAHGNATDSGPNYFTVETKAGDTYYYGQTTDANDVGDAFVEPNTVNGNNAMAKYWALKKLVDVSGNAILYHYNEEAAAGVHALTSLEYGKNEGVSASRYFNKVTFNYIDDPKPRVGYSGGSMVVMDQLLNSISITVDGSSYRHYQLNYTTSPIIEERNYLDSIEECQSAGSHCLAPLTFTWQRPPAITTSTTTKDYCEDIVDGAGNDICENYQSATTDNFEPFAAKTNLNSNSTGYQFSRVIDLNADGYSDIVFEDDGWRVLYGPGYSNSTTAISMVGTSDLDRNFILTIDYDGDGKQELLVGDTNGDAPNGNWHVIAYINGAATALNLNIEAIGAGEESAAQILDIDGDGLQDIVFQTSSQIRMYRNLGGTFAAAVTLRDFNPDDIAIAFSYDHVFNSPAMKNSAIIDVNGDGRSELLSKISMASWYCEGSTSKDTQGDCAEAGGTWTKVETFSWQVFVNDSTLANPQLSEWDSIYYTGDDLRVTDLNGDGLTDVVYYLKADNSWYYHLSNGKNFGSKHKTPYTSDEDSLHEIFFIDVNSDGRADILKPTGTTSWDILLSRPSVGSDMVIWDKRGTLARNTSETIKFGDVDGDGKLDLLSASNDNGWKVRHAARAGIIDNVITDFTNGWGVSTTVTYNSMLNDVVNISGLVSNDIADTLAPVSAMTVVQKVQSDSKTNARVAVNYRYGGLLLHRKGLGSLGFKQLQTTDAQSGVQTTTTYSQEYPYIGMPLTTQQTAAGLVISSATNSMSQIPTTSNGGVFTYIDSVEDQQHQIGTDETHYTLARTVTSNNYDSWGNLTGNTISINDGYTLLHTTTSSNNFGTADSYEQQKGRLLSSTVTKALAGQSGISRTSTFGYYAQSSVCDGVSQPQGMLQSSSVNGLTTTTCYNAFGHKARVSKTGKMNDGDSSVTTITSSSTYSADGRSIASTTNNLGHSTTLTYNDISATGTVTGLITKTSATDVNGLTVTNYIDIWGKFIATESPLSTTKTTQTSYCGNCTTGGKYYVESRQLGKPSKRVEYNNFGREIATRVQHFNNGSYSYGFKDYDDQGRLLKPTGQQLLVAVVMTIPLMPMITMAELRALLGLTAVGRLSH